MNFRVVLFEGRAQKNCWLKRHRFGKIIWNAAIETSIFGLLLLGWACFYCLARFTRTSKMVGKSRV